jgi:hypothetical protein
MSSNWVEDIAKMHEHFGVDKWVQDKVDLGRTDLLEKLMDFRIKFLAEELQEAYLANDQKAAEDLVDAMIDLCVVAIGTLDIYGVDAQKAWDEVLKANMAKQPGVKPNRPNPLGLPDLMKPEGWVGPTHEGNTGHIPND